MILPFVNMCIRYDVFLFLQSMTKYTVIFLVSVISFIQGPNLPLMSIRVDYLNKASCRFVFCNYFLKIN